MSKQDKDVDLVIAGGRLVTPDAIVEGAVAIDGGRIVAIGAADTMPPARESIDASGLHVLPGAIDVHVHFREPGFSHKETWTSATQAAAVGGVTTVFDMPNTNPPTANVAALEQKLEIAERQALVDFGIYGLIGENNLDQLEPMAQAGAVSFKLYMGSENPLVPCPSDGAILDAFEILAQLGIRCTVHAENTPILSWRGERLQRAGRRDAAAHLEQHTDVATVEAVSRTAIFAEWTGCKVHIAHESSRHSLPHIRFAKQRGVDLTVETCPHYLLLSTEDGDRLGPNFMRVKPPVREPGHAEPLWEALRDGTIDILSTDHAPHLFSEKQKDSIWECAPGFPGVETSMMLMLTQVNRGRLTLCDYVRMACDRPARAFGLHPKKGTLAVGADADIVLIDMNANGVIAAEICIPWAMRLPSQATGRWASRFARWFVDGQLQKTDGRFPIRAGAGILPDARKWHPDQQLEIGRRAGLYLTGGHSCCLGPIVVGSHAPPGSHLQNIRHRRPIMLARYGGFATSPSPS